MVIIFIGISLQAKEDCIESAFKLYQSSDYKSAIVSLKKCESSILEHESDKGIIKYYYGLGKSYLKLGKIDSAFKYQLIAFNLKNSLDIKDNLNLSLNDLGIIYNKIGLPHKSIFFLNNAIKLNLESGNRELLYDNYLNLGVTYSDLNLNDSTYKYYMLASDLSDAVNNKTKSILYNNISVLYQDKSNYLEAIKYSKLALSNNNKVSLTNLKYSTNLDILYFLKDGIKNLERVNNYYNNAKSENSKYHLADALYKLSILTSDDTNKSISYLNKSIDLLSSFENYTGAIYTLNKFKKYSISSNYDQSELDNLEKELLAANTSRIAREYGSELRSNQESQTIISKLETELYYTNIGFYGLGFIIVLFLSTGILTFYAINKYKVLNRIIDLIRNTNDYNLSETNNAKNNLGKLTYYLDNRLNYEGNEFLFNTLDDIIGNVNNLNVKQISSTNKEAECQILQHQQITHG